LPPAPPARTLCELLPEPAAAPPPPRGPGALDALRARLRAAAVELAEEHARLAPTSGSGQAAGSAREGLLAQELNRSGRYLALKHALKAAAVAFARERAAAAAEAAAAAAPPPSSPPPPPLLPGALAPPLAPPARGAAAATKAPGASKPVAAAGGDLHNELYCLMEDELRAALTGLAGRARPSSGAGGDGGAPSGAPGGAQQPGGAGGAGGDGGGAPAAERGPWMQPKALAVLAAESEEEGDTARAGGLHQERTIFAWERIGGEGVQVRARPQHCIGFGQGSNWVDACAAPAAAPSPSCRALFASAHLRPLVKSAPLLAPAPSRCMTSPPSACATAHGGALRRRCGPR
jgi:hypothetical protein